MLSLLIICSIVFLGITYLVQVNGLVNYSYQIRDLKDNLSDLQSENQNLEMQIANYQSPATLDALVSDLDLIEADNVIYLEKDKAVAVVNY